MNPKVKYLFIYMCTHVYEYDYFKLNFYPITIKKCYELNV